MKTLYSKYSNERRKEFSIKTVIAETNGLREVIKYPACHVSRGHIERLVSSGNKINGFLGESGFRSAPCREKNGGVSFDFIEGKTLEEFFEELCDNGRVEEVYRYMAEFKKRLMENSHVVSFKPCDEFKHIFGALNTDKELHAADFSCLDLVFGNIIIRENEIYIIDYEWCFDFQIPVEYIVYRAINNYIVLNQREALFKDIYEYIDIDEELRSIFDGFEKGFQSYVRGNAVVLRDFYEENRKDYYPLENILEFINPNEKIQIYYSMGGDFCEIEGLKKNYRSETRLEIDIPVYEGVRTIRLDPSDNGCVVIMENVYATGEEPDYRPEIISNGYEREGIFFFGENDPQLHFINLKEGTKLIHIEYQISPLNDIAGKRIGELARAYNDEVIRAATINHRLNLANIEMNNQKNEFLRHEGELNESIIAKDAEISALKAENERQASYISDIENSKGWKAIVKIRKLLGRG